MRLLEGSPEILATVVRIAGVLLVALIARKLVQRLIDRVVERVIARGEKSSGDDRKAASARAPERAKTLAGVLTALAAVTVWVLTVLLVLGEVGINLAPLIAGLGIVGVALGFGAQNLVSDLVSGLFMLAEDQYGVGDFLDVDGTMGTVEHVGLRTTQIRALDGALWTVRNGEISKTGNSSRGWGRVVLDVGVAYGCDLRRAKEVIKAAADELYEEDAFKEAFKAEPEVWGVTDLGDDAVAIRLVCTTEAGAQWGLGRELRLRIKEALDRESIEIPFPQRTVWLRTEPATLTEPIPIVQTAPAGG
ncbi:MAG: mechanosensitive ion channel family protein [Actinomycetota bacterium]